MKRLTYQKSNVIL